MFTGIIQSLGKVTRLEPKELLHVGIEVPAEWQSLSPGASVAINGCCLTLLRSESRLFWFELGKETLACTNLGRLQLGSLVNLERAARIDSSLDGHMVTAHVDTIGEIKETYEEKGMQFLTIQVDRRWRNYFVHKGSITLDGVSLTINTVTDETFSVGLLPYTLRATTLRDRNVGDSINIEFDILGKYVARALEQKDTPSAPWIEPGRATTTQEADHDAI